MDGSALRVSRSVRTGRVRSRGRHERDEITVRALGDGQQGVPGCPPFSMSIARCPRIAPRVECHTNRADLVPTETPLDGRLGCTLFRTIEETARVNPMHPTRILCALCTSGAPGSERFPVHFPVLFLCSRGSSFVGLWLVRPSHFDRCVQHREARDGTESWRKEPTAFQPSSYSVHLQTWTVRMQNPRLLAGRIRHACSSSSSFIPLNSHSLRQMGHFCSACDPSHLLMHCRWKAWLHCPHTTGLSSPGNLASGGHAS